MAEFNGLPLGWTEYVIEDVVATGGIFKDGDWVESKDQDPNGDVRLIQLADIGDGRFVDKSSRFLTASKARELNCTFLKAGDILVARMPDPLGRCCIFPLNGEGLYVTVVDVCIIRFGETNVNAKFMMHLINSPSIRGKISALQSGSTRKRISRGNLATIPFPLPPLNEQHRIIAKIEILLSELDKGIESLKTAHEQLKVYRQSVLKHAFEGKLTARWREENKDKLESPEQLLARIQQERQARYQQQLKDWQAAVKACKKNGKKEKIPRKPKEPEKLSNLSVDDTERTTALPYGWSWVPLNGLLSVDGKAMATGPFGTALRKSEHKSNGVPVLGIENIGQGKFESGNKIFVTEEKACELAAFRVNPKDIVISRSGTVGEICEIPDGLRNALISTNLLRVSLNHKVISSPYFVLMFQGGEVKLQVKDLCKGSSREFLNQSILGSIRYPLCGLQEQAELIREIEAKFSIIDNNEAEIKYVLAKAETLRQSILKKAFSGQLVPQDPCDEPADVLIECIQVKRSAQNPAKREAKM